MDQTQLHTLDPKLREAYERVMGTASTPQPAPAQPTASASIPVAQPAVPQPQHDPWATTNNVFQQSNPVHPQPIAAAPQAPVPPPQMQQPLIPSQPVMQQVPIQQPQPPTPPPIQQPIIEQPPLRPAAPPQQHPATLASLDTTDATQMHAYVSDEVAGVKQSLKLIQMIYIIGGIIFFAVYALFWVNFFNIALPF